MASSPAKLSKMAILTVSSFFSLPEAVIVLLFKSPPIFGVVAVEAQRARFVKTIHVLTSDTMSKYLVARRKLKTSKIKAESVYAHARSRITSLQSRKT